MKITNPLTLAAWTFAITLFAGSTMTCPAENLYSAAITAKFNIQRSSTAHACHRVDGQKVCDDVEVKTIQSFPVNNASLLNLLLGHSPLSLPPPNLMFAVSFGCEDNAQLVIFDRSTSNVVAVVADLTAFDLIRAGRVVCSGNNPCEAVDTSFQGFITLSFHSLGIPGTNSIDGGEIRLYAKGSLSPEGCITKAISSGSGKINATVDGEAIELFVSNFGLVTGRKVGTPPPAQSSSGLSDTTLTPGSITPVSIGGYVDTTLSVSSAMMVWRESDAAETTAWTTIFPTLTRDTNDLSTLDLSTLDPAVAAWVQQAAEAREDRQLFVLPREP